LRKKASGFYLYNILKGAAKCYKFKPCDLKTSGQTGYKKGVADRGWMGMDIKYPDWMEKQGCFRYLLPPGIPLREKGDT